MTFIKQWESHNQCCCTYFLHIYVNDIYRSVYSVSYFKQKLHLIYVVHQIFLALLCMTWLPVTTTAKPQI